LIIEQKSLSIQSVLNRTIFIYYESPFWVLKLSYIEKKYEYNHHNVDDEYLFSFGKLTMNETKTKPSFSFRVFRVFSQRGKKIKQQEISAKLKILRY